MDDDQDNARDTTASDMEESKHEIGNNPIQVKRQQSAALLDDFPTLHIVIKSQIKEKGNKN